MLTHTYYTASVNFSQIPVDSSFLPMSVPSALGSTDGHATLCHSTFRRSRQDGRPWQVEGALS